MIRLFLMLLWISVASGAWGQESNSTAPAGASTGPAGQGTSTTGEGTLTGDRVVNAAAESLTRVWAGFNLERFWLWVIDHAFSVMAVFVGAMLLRWVVHIFSNRIIEALTRRALRGTQLERENRAKTLSSVFYNTATTLVYAGAILILLDEFGIPISTLLGGVAVFGLAVAFGAQNLIKDYFYGFMILLENQYGVNDVIKIAGIAGSVERVTLRMTMLRDAEGTVHFIPHGEVKTVSNMTHGWSKALFNIGIAYNEDPERVMEILKQIGRELRQEPEFQDKILDDPEMLGVDALGDSAVVILFSIKTGPKQQWSVKREMLKRIQKKFNELGIVIPFPTRTVYYQQSSKEPAAPDDLESGAT